MAGPELLYSHSWFLYPRASPVPLNSMAALYCSTLVVFLQHEHLDHFSFRISRVINQPIPNVSGFSEQLTGLIGAVLVCLAFLWRIHQIKLMSKLLLLLSLLFK